MANMTRVRKALIVGGGIAGMAAAIRLRSDGIAVDLVDSDPNWRALGAGLTLNGATLRAFRRLDMLDGVTSTGHVHGGRRIHDGRGVILRDVEAYTPDPDDLAAGAGILRPALHALMSHRVRAAGTKVVLGVSVDLLDDQGDRIEARFTNGHTDSYDLVIGADGIMSAIRRLAFPDAPQPAFTGQGCWRAVFPRPNEVGTTWVFVDRRIKIGFNPVSDAQMYMFLLEAAPGNPWRGPAGLIGMLREKMAHIGGLPTKIADRLNETSQVIYRPLDTILLSPPWHRGRVVLIGDATHAVTPHAGYGVGLAIEDAIILADMLRDIEPLQDALTAYTERRYPRCCAVLEASLALGRLEMTEAPVARQLAASADLFAMTRNPF